MSAKPPDDESDRTRPAISLKDALRPADDGTVPIPHLGTAATTPPVAADPFAEVPVSTSSTPPDAPDRTLHEARIAPVYVPPGAEPQEPPKPHLARSILATGGIVLLLALIPVGYLLLQEEDVSCQCGADRLPQGRHYAWEPAPDCVRICLARRGEELRDRTNRAAANTAATPQPGVREPAVEVKFSPPPYTPKP